MVLWRLVVLSLLCVRHGCVARPRPDGGQVHRRVDPAASQTAMHSQEGAGGVLLFGRHGDLQKRHHGCIFND